MVKIVLDLFPLARHSKPMNAPAPRAITPPPPSLRHPARR